MTGSNGRPRRVNPRAAQKLKSSEANSIKNPYELTFLALFQRRQYGEPGDPVTLIADYRCVVGTPYAPRLVEKHS